MGLDGKITKNLKGSVTVTLDNRLFRRPFLGGTGVNTMEDLFKDLLQTPKWTPPYINGLPVGNNVDENPFALFDADSFKDNQDRGNSLYSRLNYDVPFVKGLSLTTSYTRREKHMYSKQYQVPYELYNFALKENREFIISNELDYANPVDEIENGDRIDEGYDFSQDYLFNIRADYKKSLGQHEISGLVAYEQGEGSGYGFNARTYGVFLKGIPTQDAFQGLSETEGDLNESGKKSYIGRLNYTYGGRYLLEATGRLDWGTELHPDERREFFPSIALGWIASEESFFRNNIRFIDFFKVRLSLGKTGGTSLTNYEYLVQFQPSSDYLFGSTPVPGLGFVRNTDAVSTGVTWEKQHQYNLGVDLRTLKDKLSVTFDYWYNYSYDILEGARDIPPTAGVDYDERPKGNYGRLHAWGYDLEMEFKDKIGSNWNYFIKGLFSFSTNRILEQQEEYASNDWRSTTRKSTYQRGREQGYFTDGIIRTQEQLDAINADWNAKWGWNYQPFGTPAQLGMLYFQDIARPGNTLIGEPSVVFEPDGIVDTYDQYYIDKVNDTFVWKNILPRVVQMGVSYKNIKLSTLFTMEYGTNSKMVDKLALSAPTRTENTVAFWKDYYTEDNKDAAYPNPYFETMNELKSTFWIKDIYQLRMRTINLSYTLPKRLSDKWGIPSLRVYFLGENLWTPVSTFDYKEDAIARYNTYPLLKKFHFGVNINL